MLCMHHLKYSPWNIEFQFAEPFVFFDTVATSPPGPRGEGDLGTREVVLRVTVIAQNDLAYVVRCGTQATLETDVFW